MKSIILAWRTCKEPMHWLMVHCNDERTLWRNPSDQLVRVYLIPVSQLSHLDIANIKVDSQIRCHLKDISKLNTNVQKYFINSSLLNVSMSINSYQCNYQCYYNITSKIIRLPIYFINFQRKIIYFYQLSQHSVIPVQWIQEHFKYWEMSFAHMNIILPGQ